MVRTACITGCRLDDPHIPSAAAMHPFLQEIIQPKRCGFRQCYPYGPVHHAVIIFCGCLRQLGGNVFSRGSSINSSGEKVRQSRLAAAGACRAMIRDHTDGKCAHRTVMTGWNEIRKRQSASSMRIDILLTKHRKSRAFTAYDNVVALASCIHDSL